MIGEFVLNIFFNVVSSFFEILPDFSWSFDSGILSPIYNLLKLVLYFFPVDIVFWIFSFYIWKTNFKIVIATLRTIMDILPLV